jgi:SAM-dependent methyltransferase
MPRSAPTGAWTPCARAGAPLAAIDLRALAVRGSAAVAYLSLGVVEHDPDGPDAIVAEAARVLAPGGVLLLSVPYWNGVRRLSAPWLERNARRTRAGGGQFYQFAFTRAEVRRFVEAAGFQVRAFHPYDPARILRGALRRVRRAPAAAAAPAVVSVAPRTGGARGWLRAALYSPPALRLLGHMILAIAVKPGAR